MSTNHHIQNDTFSSLIELAKGIRVLYVEDDPLIRREYLTFLGRIFDNIHSEENGEKGLEAATNHHFDIVISDIQMPKMNGLQMIEKIKEKYPDLATLLISAHKESDILHHSVQLGVDGYIFKPLERNQTITLLHKIVLKIKMGHENLRYKEHLEELVREKTREAFETYSIDRTTGLFSLAKFELDILELPNRSLVLLKIGNFKNLNDFYGYEIGNNILKQTADFLRHIVKYDLSMTHHSLYRLSGTHFAILSPLDADPLKRFVNHVIQKFESTEINIDDHLMYLEMDAGIVDYSENISLSKADFALRQAEKKGHIVLYKKDENDLHQHSEKLQCKDQIKRALRENRIVPYYQPIINNVTMEIEKYEVLARMVLPEGKIVSPGYFIPIAKETKMYTMITKIIIQQAFHDFRHSECSISLNLSIDDLKHTPTREFIFQHIALFPDPKRLVFELLESEEIESYDELQEFLTELKSFGCKVAIDDFGSGYSNFEHLAKLNIDYIKIDGSLIMEIDTAFVAHSIVEMIVSFASKMGIKTIAEYVEKESISILLASIGIDESQGYLFGRPLPYHSAMNRIQSYPPLNSL